MWEPAPTMMVLADASALDTTSSGELVAGMTTSLVLVGTPPVQFAAVCQESVGPGPVLKVSTAMTPSMKSRCRQLGDAHLVTNVFERTVVKRALDHTLDNAEYKLDFSDGADQHPNVHLPPQQHISKESRRTARASYA
jgi:hypothetical protein